MARDYPKAPERFDVFGTGVLGQCVMRAHVNFDSPSYKQKARGNRLVIMLVVDKDDEVQAFDALRQLSARRLRMEIYAPEVKLTDFEAFFDGEADELDGGPIVVNE